MVFCDLCILYFGSLPPLSYAATMGACRLSLWLALCIVRVCTGHHGVHGSMRSAGLPWDRLPPIGTTFRLRPFQDAAAPKTFSSASQESSKHAYASSFRVPAPFLPRGGHSNGFHGSFSSSGNASYQPTNLLVQIVATITQVLVSLGRFVLPPAVAVVRGVVRFYNALPMDAIVAQVGLVYCFLGGYYPTLFSSLQAAQYCGWHVMVSAIADLTEEAMKVIDATENMDWDGRTPSDRFFEQTGIVLKTVDPMKINQAAAALYTTWLGVSAVLEREYARVISLSLTLAQGVETVARVVLQPPLNLVVPTDYQKWIPAVIGWVSKGVAMNVAWRIQRVLTASTSAIAGGMMFARALMGMLNKRGVRVLGDVNELGPDETTLFEELVGFSVASLGFYTQMECQAKNNFSFEVKFPFILVTWPFDLAERWIQWYITK
jgi:hypothetical protein